MRKKTVKIVKKTIGKNEANLNNSIETINKYKHLFGDVEGTKSLRTNNKSVQFKRAKDIAPEEGDLSSIRNQDPKNKHSNTIFTFRRENETLRNKNKRNDILTGMEDIMQMSDSNIKRFHSNDFFK